MNPTIIRSRTTDPFARIPKSMLEDESLSWKAKGLLCYLLGKPDDWQVRVGDIIANGTDGRDAVRAGLIELRVAGYAELRLLTSHGRAMKYQLHIADTKKYTSAGAEVRIDATEPETENTVTELQLPEKAVRTKKEETKKEETEKESAASAAPSSKADAEAVKANRSEFIDAWWKEWKSAFGTTYAAQKRDWKMLKEFLDENPELKAWDLMEVAVKAWKHKNGGEKHFYCKQSVDIYGFLKWFNQIRGEVASKLPADKSYGW